MPYTIEDFLKDLEGEEQKSLDRERDLGLETDAVSAVPPISFGQSDQFINPTTGRPVDFKKELGVGEQFTESDLRADAMAIGKDYLERTGKTLAILPTALGVAFQKHVVRNAERLMEATVPSFKEKRNAEREEHKKILSKLHAKGVEITEDVIKQTDPTRSWIEKVEDKLMADPDIHPLSKYVARGAGELAFHLIPMGKFIGAFKHILKGTRAYWLAPAFGMATYEGLKTLPEEGITKSLKAGAEGGLFGLFVGGSTLIKQPILQALTGILGFPAMSYTMRAIKEKSIPDPTRPDVLAQLLLDVGLSSYFAKREIARPGQPGYEVDPLTGVKKFNQHKVEVEKTELPEPPEVTAAKPALHRELMEMMAEMEMQAKAKEPAMPEIPGERVYHGQIKKGPIVKPEAMTLAGKQGKPSPEKPPEPPLEPGLAKSKVADWPVIEKSLKKQGKTEAEIAEYKDAFDYKQDSLKAFEARATLRLEKNGIEKTIEELRNKTNFDSTDSALTTIIPDRLLAEGKTKEAVKFVEEIRPKATAAGQAVKAFDLVEKISPTGMVKDLVSIFKEIRGAGKKQPKAYKKLLEKLDVVGLADKYMSEAKRVSGMPRGVKQERAWQSMWERINKDVDRAAGKKGVLKKLSTWQAISQLFSGKTQARNLFGTGLFDLVDMGMQTFIGVPMDAITSVFTKQRTTTIPQLKAWGKGFKKFFKESVKDQIADSDTIWKQLEAEFGSKLVSELKKAGVDLSSRWELILSGRARRAFSGKGLQKLGLWMERILGIGLESTDRGFFGGNLMEAIRNMQKARKSDIVTPEMLQIAVGEALQRTFRDTNLVTKAATTLKTWMNKLTTGSADFGLGDFIIKYPRTPANLFVRGIEYTPIGVMKTMVQLLRANAKGIGEFQAQREAIRGFTRGLGGSALFYGIGAILQSLGVITLREEKLKGVRAKTAVGRRENSINISAVGRIIPHLFSPTPGESIAKLAKERPGDKWSGVAELPPLSIPFLAGARFAEGKAKRKKEGKGINIAESLVSVVESAAQVLREQPFYSGVATFTKGLNLSTKEGLRSSFKRLVSGAPSTFIPTLLRQVRYLSDKVMRDTKDEDLFKEMSNKIKNNIPWLSASLPAKRDVVGKRRAIVDDERIGTHSTVYDFLNIFVNPIITTTEKKGSEGMRFLIRLYEMTGETKHLPRTVQSEELTYKGLKIPIDKKDRLELQKRLGIEVNERLNKLVENKAFMRASPERQIEYVYNLLNRLGRRIRNRYFVEKYRALKGSRQTQPPKQ
jgi:hypothetical protein